MKTSAPKRKETISETIVKLEKEMKSLADNIKKLQKQVTQLQRGFYGVSNAAYQASLGRG